MIRCLLSVFVVVAAWQSMSQSNASQVVAFIAEHGKAKLMHWHRRALVDNFASTPLARSLWNEFCGKSSAPAMMAVGLIDDPGA